MKKYGYEELSEKEKLSRKDLWKFWKNPINKSMAEKNQPNNYLKGGKRSKYLVELISNYLHDDQKILEIGCNVGRNLNFLYNAGYMNLSGIEINKEALNLMKENFPEMYMNLNLYNNPVEYAIKEIPTDSYDLVFTMAVLEHIHYESNFIFSEMTRIAEKYLVTVEDEVTTWSDRHFPRNYKEIFEKEQNWKQVYEINCEKVNIFDDRFWVRVFKKNV